MENPPLPLFHNNFSRFRNLKIDVFLQLLRVCEWGGLTKSLSKISLKSSSKQTDYEKFSSLWTKIWYCSGDVLYGWIFELSIRSTNKYYGGDVSVSYYWFYNFPNQFIWFSVWICIAHFLSTCSTKWKNKLISSK